MPSSVREGSRPRELLIFSNSSGVMPWSSRTAGVIGEACIVTMGNSIFACLPRSQPLFIAQLYSGRLLQYASATTQLKKMKAITLTCAIVFSLYAAWQASFLVQNISRYHYPPYIVGGQVFGVLCQCCLAAFFFTLYSRQR